MNVPLLACSISIPFLAVKNKRYKITMGRRRSGSWCKQTSIDSKSLMLYPCFSYCHRIGWWENFNRKPLKIWWYFNHGFRLRFPQQNQSIDIEVRTVPGTRGLTFLQLVGRNMSRSICRSSLWQNEARRHCVLVKAQGCGKSMEIPENCWENHQTSN